MTQFNLSRCSAYMRFDLAARRSELLLPLGLPSALLLFTSFIGFALGNAPHAWPNFSFSLGLMLAVSAAVKAHRREIDPTTAPLWLLLPASHVERFVVRMVSSFIVPFFLQALWLTLLVNLLAACGGLMGQSWEGWISPAREDMLSTLGMFTLSHGVFFTGGIFFRKNALMRTIFAFLAYAALVSLGTGVFVFSSGSEKMLLTLAMSAAGLGATDTIFSSVQGLERVLWCGVLPLLLYIAAYFSATENEVRE